MIPYTEDEITELFTNIFNCGTWPESRCSNIRSARYFSPNTPLKSGAFLIIDNDFLTASQAEEILAQINQVIQAACDAKGITPPPQAFFGSIYTDEFLQEHPAKQLQQFAISSEGIDFLKNHDVHPDLTQVMAHAAEIEQANVKRLDALKQKLEDVAQLPNCVFKTALRITEGNEPGSSFMITIEVPTDSMFPRHMSKEYPLLGLCDNLNDEMKGLAHVSGECTRYNRDGLDKSATITFSADTAEALDEAINKLQAELQPAFQQMTKEAALLQDPHRIFSSFWYSQKDKEWKPSPHKQTEEKVSTQHLDFMQKTIGECGATEGHLIYGPTTGDWLRHLVNIAEGEKAASVSPNDALLRQKRAERVLNVVAKEYPVYAEVIGEMRTKDQGRSVG